MDYFVDMVRENLLVKQLHTDREWGKWGTVKALAGIWRFDGRWRTATNHFIICDEKKIIKKEILNRAK